MTDLLVAVYDEKARYHSSVHVAPNQVVAIRNFEDGVHSSPAFETVRRHPQDFSLVVLAEFDAETGSLNNVNRVVLCRASDIYQPEVKNA